MGNVFGLGILLTLEDQASNRLNGFSNSLQRLSMRAMSLNYMGKSLINTGKAMLSPVIGLSKELIRVNSDAEKARITLNALYQDPTGTAGMAKYKEIVEYAAKTPFEIEELRDASLQFKTLGVEILGAGSEVTSSTGKTKEFMSILGDMGAGLSGVARNGFKDVTYAVREFVTEGNKLSFLRRLGVDIDAVLSKAGKSVGNTIEERLVNMADLAEILHFEDLTGKMFGTWSQVISNMKDVWDLFLLGVGDTETGLAITDDFGNTVFGGFKRTLRRVQEMMGNLNLYDFGKAVGEGLYSIIQPLDMIAEKLVGVASSLAQFIASHPAVAKYALLLPTIAGALFLVAGAALMAKGSMLVFGYGLGVIVGMLPKLMLYAGAFAVIRTAWTEDIGGIRTRLTDFVNDIKTSMSETKRIWALGNEGMIDSYKHLVYTFETTGDFTSGFTARILEVKNLWLALVEFWNNDANSLSPERLKILQDMGLLPVFEKIAVWTARFKEFFDGVVEGFTQMANAVGDFVNKTITKFFPSLDNGDQQGLFNMITGSFDGSAITKAKGIGNFVAKALPAFLVVKKLVGIVNTLSGRRNRHGLGDIIRNLMGGRNGDETAPNTRGFANLLNSLGIIRVGTAVKGVTNLGIIMTAFMGMATVFGGFVNLFGVDTIGKGIAALGALAVAMLPLGTPAFTKLIDTLKRLAQFKVKTIGKGILQLGIIVGGLAAISAISLSLMAIPMAFMDIGTMYAMVGVLYLMGALGAALVYFSNTIGKVPVSTVALGLANLAIMIAGMAVLFMALGAVSLIPFDYGRVAKLVLCIGLIGLVGSALVALASDDGILSLLTGGLYTGAIALGLANMAIMLAGLAIVFMALGAVSLIPFDYGRVAKLVLCIGLIGIVGSVLSELGFIAGTIPTTLLLKGMANIALALAGFGVLAYAFSYALKYTDQIEQGCQVISKIAGGIGEAIGSLVGGIGVGLTNGLPDIASNISGFITNLNPLFNLAKDENSTKVGIFFKSLGEGLLAIAKSNIASAFSGGLQLGEIAEQLDTFAHSAQSAFNSFSEYPDAGIEKAPRIFEALEGMNGYQFKTKGLAQLGSGGNGIGTIGQRLDEFAHSAQSAFNCFSEYPEAGIEKAPRIFESLEGMGSYIFKTKGLAQSITGGNGIGTIGKRLDEFAHSAQSAFNSFSEYPDAGIEKAPRIFEALAGMGSNSFRTKGLEQLWSGGNGIGTIGKRLDTFAHSAQSAFNSFSEYPEAGIEKAPRIFEALTSLTVSDATPYSNLPTVGKQLNQFAHLAQSAFNCFSEFTEGGFNNVDLVVTSLQNLSNITGMALIPNINGLGTSLSNVISIMSQLYPIVMTVGDILVAFGNASALVSVIIDTSFILIANSATANSALVVSAFTVMGVSVITSAMLIVTGMNMVVIAILAGCASMVSAITSACATCQGVLSAFAASGYGYGASLVYNIAAGISANAGAISSAIQGAVASAAGSVAIQVPVNVGQNYNGTDYWRGGLTTIHERGGELVDLPTGTRIYPHDESVTMAFDDGVRTAMSQINSGGDSNSYDESVHFHAGAIVVQANGASEAEAERLAELIMQKIERKKRRKAIATYQY